MAKNERKPKVPTPAKLGGQGGKDEMNLAELPFASLRNRGDTRKAIVYEGWATDEAGNRYYQEWIAQGGSLVGLPNEFDERVLVALLAITAGQKFRSRKVPFSVYQIVKIMGLTRSRQTYEYVENSLDRLLAISFKSKQAFWDNQDKQRVTNVRGFHLIEEYWLRYQEADDAVKEQEGVPGYIVWSEELWKSFQSGYIKNLDLDFFYMLQSPLARRLYRFLDKRMQYQNRYEIDIFELAGRLGMTRYKYPSKVLSKLEPAVNELIEEEYLAAYEVFKVGKYTRIRFIQEADPPEDDVVPSLKESANLDASAPSNQEVSKEQGLATGEVNPQAAVVAALVGLGLAEEVADQLTSSYASNQILEKIAHLAFLQQSAPEKIQNPLGWLRCAIEEDYAAPHGYPDGARGTGSNQQERQASFWEEMPEEERARPQTWAERVAAQEGVPQTWQTLTRQLQDSLKTQMTQATFDTWLNHLMITSVEDGQVTIAVPSQSAWEWLTHRLRAMFERTLSRLLDREVAVEFIVSA